MPGSTLSNAFLFSYLNKLARQYECLLLPKEVWQLRFIEAEPLTKGHTEGVSGHNGIEGFLIQVHCCFVLPVPASKVITFLLQAIDLQSDHEGYCFVLF